MLAARFKLAPPEMIDAVGRRYWEARCERADCGGLLALFAPGLQRYVNFAPGYVEVSPGCWKLGRHAAHNRRHAPRRVRASSIASAASGRRDARGVLTIDGPGGPFPVLGIPTQPRGGPALSRMQQRGPSAADAVFLVWCPDHGHLNAVRVADLERKMLAATTLGSD